MHEPPQFSRSFAPNATIQQYARVKLLSTGLIDVAGLTDIGIGVAMREAFAADVTNATPIAVALDGPIRKCIAIEAGNAGAIANSEANGKVQDTATVTSFPIGVFLEAQNGDGHIVDVMIRPAPAAN